MYLFRSIFFSSISLVKFLLFNNPEVENLNIILLDQLFLRVYFSQNYRVNTLEF